MKQRFPALAAALCGLALAAGGGDDPHVTVPEAPAGIYLVTTGSEDALSSGHYYVGEDGSATLAIEGTAGAGLMRLFKHAAGGHWRAVPPAQEDLRVSFLERRDDAVVITTLAALAALAGPVRGRPHSLERRAGQPPGRGRAGFPVAARYRWQRLRLVGLRRLTASPRGRGARHQRRCRAAAHAVQRLAAQVVEQQFDGLLRGLLQVQVDGAQRRLAGPGAQAVVVLSHAYWTRRFGSNPRVA